MRLRIPDPDRGFALQRRDGLVLITPRREKQSRADWRDDELPMRSIVLREADGEVVSAGFPKFFNWQEDGPETQRLILALAEQEEVHFTEKVDGSLCVRSVIDGRVVFRTRGTLDETDYTLAMRAVAERKYPQLLDPSIAPFGSLLFEFVHPDFRVVLGYDEADLILIGAVVHSTLGMLEVDALRAAAYSYGLRLVDLVALPTEPTALMEAVRALDGSEGVVARCDRGMTLVKLKSASYLALHRLRFLMSAKTVREVCIERNVREPDDFLAYLAEHDADWELVDGVLPLVEQYITTTAIARSALRTLASRVAENAHLPRKDFAVDFAVRLGAPWTSAAFALLDGKNDAAWRILRDDALDRAFADLEAADEARLASVDG